MQGFFKSFVISTMALWCLFNCYQRYFSLYTGSEMTVGLLCWVLGKNADSF